MPLKAIDRFITRLEYHIRETDNLAKSDVAYSTQVMLRIQLETLQFMLQLAKTEQKKGDTE